MEHALKLNLDRSPPKYQTNDTVEGHITYTPETTSGVRIISVTLSGCAKTSHYVGIHHSQTCRELFSTRIELYRGSLNARESSLYPFAISFPAGMTEDGDSRPDDTSVAGAQRRPDRPLPPSLDVSVERAFKDPQAHGRITYTITARLEDLDRPSQDVENCVQLTYMPTSITSPDMLRQHTSISKQQDFVRNSWDLVPNHHRRSLSFKNRVSGLLHTERTPSWAFSITVNLPDRVFPGGSVVGSLSLTRSHENSSDMPAPEVTMKSLQVRLISIAHLVLDTSYAVIQTFNTFQRDFDNERNIRTERCSYETTDAEPLTLENDYTKYFQYDLSADAPPNFETMYIRYKHCWEAKYQVECLGKMYERKESVPVRVAPKPLHQPNARGDDVQESDAVNEPPPPYIRPPTYSTEGEG